MRESFNAPPSTLRTEVMNATGMNVGGFSCTVLGQCFRFLSCELWVFLMCGEVALDVLPEKATNRAALLYTRRLLTDVVE